MKTYSELKRNKPFNWFEALSKEDISDKEWVNLYHKAQFWVTCACGNQCAIIPRDNDGEPIDRKLTELGMQFYELIRFREREKALKVLNKIERRSNQLIIKIQRDLNEQLSYL